MGAGPVVTLANNVFTFTEQANVTGSLFNHTGTRSGTVTDDNAIDDAPEYQVLFTLDPTPSLLPWNLFVDIDVDGDSFDDPIWQGTIDVDFFVEDRQLDFLRQGQTVTQNIIVKITDVNDANVFTNQTIQVQITGANDRPTAHLDFLSLSENYTIARKQVLGNDLDPDFGDTKALTAAGFQVFSVTSAAAPYLTTAMVSAARINFADNTLPLKDAIQVTLNTAFQGLTTGENALVVVKYGMVDGFGATSASEFRLTVIGSPDAQIFGTNANNPFIFGEKDADTISALAGNDTVTPRGGNDTLILGAGFDTIVFNTAPNTASNRDIVSDFNPAQDIMRMENAIFTKLGAAGPLNAGFFRTGAVALDANDYIVYNSATGALSYDANGNGAGGGIHFAVLTNKPVLTASDFAVI